MKSLAIKPYRRLFTFAFLLTMIFIPLHLYAQSREVITAVDCRNADLTCRLYLYHPALSMVAANALAADAVKIQVDDQPQLVSAAGVQMVGAQVAFGLDASFNTLRNGHTGLPRYQEFAKAVREYFLFFQGRAPLSEQDWLAAYTTGITPDAFPAIVNWQNSDHGRFVGSVEEYIPQKELRVTPLFKLLRAMLNRFAEAGAPPHLLKSIVIFSDGYDEVRSLELDDVINEAVAKGIHIHTVLIGPGRAQERQNLARIAELTGGEFVEMTTLEALTPIWNAIAQERQQAVISYPLGSAQPQAVTADVTLPDGQLLRGQARNLLLPAFQAPRPVIQADNSLLTIQRTAPTFAATAAQLEPAGESISFQIEWPDGYPRPLTQLEIWLNGNLYVPEAVITDNTIQLPVRLLREGESQNTLLLRAVDSFGLAGESQPVALRLQVTYPAAPTATPLPPTPTLAPPTPTLPVPTATPTVAPPALNLAERILNTLPLLLGLGILVALGVWWLKRQTPVEEPMDHLFDAVQPEEDPTEPEHLDITEPVAEADVFPLASLVLERGGDHLPKEIPLHTRENNGRVIRRWTVGRSQTKSNYIIADQRVSKLHATIFQQGGQFYIQDEGASGGTYLNRQKLRELAPTPLHGDDVINFNAVAYRFVLDTADFIPFGAINKKQSGRPPVELRYTPDADLSDATEPAD